MKLKTVGIAIGVLLLIIIATAGAYSAGSNAPAVTITQTQVQTVVSLSTQTDTSVQTFVSTQAAATATITVAAVTTSVATQSVTVTVTANPITRKSDLIIRGETSGIGSYGWYNVRGEVYNNGTGIARNVYVYATFYDINNKVVCTTLTTTRPSDIYAREAAPFELTCLDEAASQNIQSFKLVADIV